MLAYYLVTWSSLRPLDICTVIDKTVCQAGLPDGIFSNQNSQFGYIFEGLVLENVGILFGHLEYFTAT
jgi:hypothetical protein